MTSRDLIMTSRDLKVTGVIECKITGSHYIHYYCTHKPLTIFYWVCYIMYTNLTSLCHSGSGVCIVLGKPGSGVCIVSGKARFGSSYSFGESPAV